MVKRVLLPDDEKLLARYFSGALEAEMGVRSTMGTQIESLMRGYILHSGGYEMDERCLAAARDVRRITEVLHRLPKRTQKVLALWYTPRLTRELSGPLKTFGPYGRLVVFQWHEELSKLIKMCNLTYRKKKDVDVRAAMANVYKLQWDAEKQVQQAIRDYAEVLKKWKKYNRIVKKRKEQLVLGK